MIYTPMTRKAMRLMFDAHKEQVDKTGLPYVFHPFHVAEQMEDEATTIVALLHDVVEDTDYTLEQIRAMGFSEEVCQALDLMTHREGVPYMDYIRAIRRNPLATKVKLADLRHNSDITRMDTLTEQDIRRREKYQEAMCLLLEET
ncbi:MAG: HD domain-containing protein [Clostridia bacterium]|jgi:(p)ppGpp synthase/HD superfamily hydrolase|nr:HD domain-containing protein [Clostridia bacterium]MBQ1554623.1 HD domain-containing protein [Clostridia bacterium]MBQ4397470.1 HD domain-containing protein [Clostridia bacterium]